MSDKQGTTGLAPAIDADIDSIETERAGLMRYYHDRRSGGPPLVLLHSINAAPSAMEVKPLFEHYRDSRTVYAPDLPGFGLSSRQALRYTPQLYAGVIRQFLDEVVGPGADVIAMSLTAEFAARAIGPAPDACRSLAVISPTGLGDRNPPGEATSERLRKLFGAAAFGQGLYRLLTSRPSIRFFLNKAFQQKAPGEIVDYAYATSHRPGARYAPFTFLSMGLFSSDARITLYEPLTVPALVLYDRDPNVSFERLSALLEANPLWRAQRIAPTQGLPHWEKPSETFAALDRFWLEQAGAST